MMSGQAHIEMAVRATKLGALDFLEKPISTDKLLLTVENALKLQRLESENRQLRQRLGKHEMVWTGETMKKLMAQIERVAASETRVCILGETGTGKELVARTLHERSPRASGPFITLNCAAVPAELIESELFGHEKGSFTGAAGRHIGKFEQAERGTIFLDEIGDMPLAMQAKLLRVLEEGEVETNWLRQANSGERAGGGGYASQSGSAGERGQVSPGSVSSHLRLPGFAAAAARTQRRTFPRWCSTSRHRFARRTTGSQFPSRRRRLRNCTKLSWAGNIRELRNVVERLILLATEGQVTADTVELALCPNRGGSVARRNRHPGGAGTGFEREVILAELKRSHHHITNAAKALGLERSHLYKKAEQLGIDLQALRKEPGDNTSRENTVETVLDH